MNSIEKKIFRKLNGFFPTKWNQSARFYSQFSCQNDSWNKFRSNILIQLLLQLNLVLWRARHWDVWKNLSTQWTCLLKGLNWLIFISNNEKNMKKNSSCQRNLVFPCKPHFWNWSLVNNSQQFLAALNKITNRIYVFCNWTLWTKRAKMTSLHFKLQASVFLFIVFASWSWDNVCKNVQPPRYAILCAQLFDNTIDISVTRIGWCDISVK